MEIMEYIVTYTCMALILGPVAYGVFVIALAPLAGFFASPSTATTSKPAVNRNNRVYGQPNAKSYIRVRTHAYDYDED